MNLLVKKTLSLILILMLLSGCGKNEGNPNPPKAESTLVVEFFNALKGNDYTIASQKIKRLRMLNPKDFSLANIEYQIDLDSGFAGAQNLINEGRIKEAGIIIKGTIDKYGYQDQLIAADEKVKKLEVIQKLTDKMHKAKTSSGIAIPTGELNRFISNNKFAEPLKPFAEYSLDRARKLMTVEEIMAMDDLKADIDIAGVVDGSVLSTMMAQLAVEEAQDIMVMTYEKSMSEKWNIVNNNNLTIKLTDEKLFFRQALSSDKKTRDKMFARLLLEPPGDFSSMLLRAFILKKTGYSNECEALAQIIRNALKMEKYETIGWFKEYPDKITDFNSINPFVLYPFFVYSEAN